MPKEIFGQDYEFLHRNEWLRFAELDDLVESFVKLGVHKVRPDRRRAAAAAGLGEVYSRLSSLS
jgi:hypothetical protein